MLGIEKTNAYSALVGAIAGTLGTIIIAAFFMGGQWERWVEIRDAHKGGNVINKELGLSAFVKPADLPDLSPYALIEDIPDTSNFVKSEELPQLPELSGFVRSTDLPDFSGFALNSEIPDISAFITTSALNSALQGLGAGRTIHPNSGATTSALCTEGYAMVGVKYTVASGGNAGALYHGLYPVCRKLTR